MKRGEIPRNQKLFVCGEGNEIDEVRTLMDGTTIQEHHLAIDALMGWCLFMEEHTSARPGWNFYDRHHWQNKAARKGSPRNILGNLPEYTSMLRRDIHILVEETFGHLGKLPIREVMRYLNEK